MAHSAKEIMNFIKRRGLPYQEDLPPTPADGSCFVHSVLQQLNRSEIRGNYMELLNSVDHEGRLLISP